jgi:hypothetical protein
LSVEAQSELMTRPSGKYALERVPDSKESRLDEIKDITGSDFLVRGNTLRIGYTLPDDSLHGGNATVAPLADHRSSRWQCARVAILAVQRADTSEAKAVLRQLADGHPDILPTKEAKAALAK